MVEGLRNKILKVFNEEIDVNTKKVDTRSVKEVLSKAVYTTSLTDHNPDEEAWDGLVIDSERKKFFSEQKVLIFNEALKDRVFIDRTNARVYTNVFEKYVTDTRSEKRGEVNGYRYKGNLILKRNKQKQFRPVEGLALEDFIQPINLEQSENGSSIFKDNMKYDLNVKPIAKEYIDSLRKEQERIVRTSKDLRQLGRGDVEINEMEKEIKNIKLNKRIKIRLKLFGKNMGGRLARFTRWIKTFKWRAGGIALTITSAIVSSIVYSIEIKNGISEAAKHGGELILKAGNATLEGVNRILDKIILKV